MGYRLSPQLSSQMQSPWSLYEDEGKDPLAALGLSPMVDPRSLKAANMSVPQGLTMRAPRPPMQAPITPQVKGQGTSQKSDSEENLQGRTGSTEATWLTGPMMDSLLSNLRQTPEYQDQQASQKQNRELFRMSLNTHPSEDLATPLANLSDYVQTGKLGNRQPGGETQKDSANRLREWAKQLQDDQKDLTNTIIGGLPKLRSGTLTEQEMQLLKNHFGQAAVDPMRYDHPRAASTQNPMEKLWKAHTAYTKDDREAFSQAQNALSTLDLNSPTAFSAFKNFMARASGEKGPLSESDIQRFSGNPAIQAQIDRAWQKYTTGQMTSADKKEMQLLAQGYVNFRKDKLSNTDQYFVNQVAPTVHGIRPDAARQALIPKGGYGIPEGPKKKTLMEEFQDYKKSQVGGK